MPRPGRIRGHIPSFPRSLTSVIPANAGTQAETAPPPNPEPIRTRTHAWVSALRYAPAGMTG